MKGCYMFFEKAGTKDYFQSRMRAEALKTEGWPRAGPERPAGERSTCAWRAVHFHERIAGPSKRFSNSADAP
jgi:hypothetical protein